MALTSFSGCQVPILGLSADVGAWTEGFKIGNQALNNNRFTCLWLLCTAQQNQLSINGEKARNKEHEPANSCCYETVRRWLAVWQGKYCSAEQGSRLFSSKFMTFLCFDSIWFLNPFPVPSPEERACNLTEYGTFWTQRSWPLFDTLLLPWGRGSVLRGTNVLYLPKEEWTKSLNAAVWRNRGKERKKRQAAKWDVEGSRANTAPVIRFLPDLGTDGLPFLACASRSPRRCDHAFSLNPGWHVDSLSYIYHGIEVWISALFNVNPKRKAALSALHWYLLERFLGEGKKSVLGWEGRGGE